MSAASTHALVRLPVWRARFVLFLFLAAFAVLAVRALVLQALETDFLQGKGDARYSRLLEVPATRGDEVAQGLIEARAQQERDVPMVVRIVGTNAAEAAELLQAASFVTAGSLDEAAAKAVAAARQVTA